MSTAGFTRYSRRMPTDEHDPIADTGMFRAFVAQGESDDAEGRSLGTPVILAVLAALVVTAVLIWMLAS